MRSIVFSFLISVSSLICSAQLAVDNTLTVVDLVNNVLLGEGVESSNLTFNHGEANVVSSQFGYFSNGGPHIGISNGVILATGGVSVAEGPNDIPTAHVPVPAAEQLTIDPDLSTLTGGSALRDVAIVEFDFTAQGDTLRFRYVFASEEYNDHACSPYNDAFGFFVSGPGISGSTNFANNAKNVALVPGTSIPVAINTINQGIAGIYGANSVCNAAYSNWQANSVYFVNNAANPAPETTQFDGFTVPFLIEVPVICGETYHIKIAIADAVDDKNDSAVFLEAESFNSVPIIESSLEVSIPDGVEDLALEGCSSYKLHLSRPVTSTQQTIIVKARDLENAGVIFPDLPGHVIFESGESTMTFEFSAQQDNLAQGLREWSLELQLPNTCGQDTARISLPAKINDRPALVLSHPDTIFVPCHTTFALEVLVSGGNPPYTIVWNDTNYQGFSTQFTAEADLNVVALVTDDCNLNAQQLEIAVKAELFNPLVVSIPETVPFDCASPVQVLPQISGGVSEYQFAWMLDDSLLSQEMILNTILHTEGHLTFVVNDRCAGEKAATTEAQLLANPVVVNIGDDLEGSCIEDLVIVPEVIGGFGSLQYLWKVNQNQLGVESIFTFRPDQTSRITLQVSDQCGQQNTDTLDVFVYDPELEVHLPADTSICLGNKLELVPVVSGAIGSISYFWPVSGGSQAVYSLIPQRNNRFTVVVEDECKRTAEASVEVQVIDVNASFEFNYDFPDQPVTNLSSPQCIYQWTFPDGSFSNLENPVYDPNQNENGAVVLHVQDENGCEDSVLKFFEPPMQLYIPTAFTPDGNGKNDLFKAEGQHIADFHIWIFDKWGNLVFESTDINQAWDGRGTRRDDHFAGANIFVYRCVARSWTGAVKEGHGTITLLR